jgi:hypothetical protein
MACLFGFPLYVNWDVKRKSQKRLAEMERRREESNAYWAPRIAASILATQEAASGRVETIAHVAPLPEAPHNAGRRRILRLE